MDEMNVEETTDESVKLLDFPNEVLLRIFQHFTDTHLLDMTRVCTRFEAIAGETFAKRYNGESEEKYFKIFCNLHGDEAVYSPIFNAFGKRMTALEIVMESTAKFTQNYWMYNFIRDYCSKASITHVIVKDLNESFNYQQFSDSMPAIKHLTFVNPYYNRWVDYRYEQVINFRARNFQPIRASTVQRFVQNNPQLRSLEFDGPFTNNPLTVLSGQLNSLEWLILNGRCFESIDLAEVTLERLKTLTISLEHNSAVKILQAIERGCKQIEYLEITTYGEVQQRFEDQNDDLSTYYKRQKAERTHHFSELTRVIGTFNQLKSFSFSGSCYQSDFLEILAEHLPKLLPVLRLKFQQLGSGFESNDLLPVFMKLEHLKIVSLSSRETEEHGYGFFGLDWFREFAAVGANRKQTIRCEYNDKETNVIATKDECIVNGELRYWVGYEPDQSQSKTHILDLNEKCIDKILEWLPDEDVTNVYRTCKALKKITAKRIWSQEHRFGVHDIPRFEDWLDILADDIRKLVITTNDDYPDDDNDSIEIMKLVRDRCSKNLTEFHINIAKTSLMDNLNFSFPNLEKLTIDYIVTAGAKVLPTMNCPKLKYLEIGTYEINTVDPAVQDLHLGISIDNLTVLKLQCFDDVIASLFSTLSDKICLQLTEFTVSDMEDVVPHGNRLINMVCRFRNLIELNLIVPGIEYTNTVHLFERCTKLVKLSLGYGHDEKIQRLLVNCKKHCNNLKVIQLVYQNHSLDKDICVFISEKFPNVELYNVMEREAGDGRKYKIALYNKSLIPKDCERPY